MTVKMAGESVKKFLCAEMTGCFCILTALINAEKVLLQKWGASLLRQLTWEIWLSNKF